MKNKNNCQKTFNDILIGDILNVKNGIIVHQVNCQYTMGAGLAKQIKQKYPKHYYDYKNTKPFMGNIVITEISKSLYIIGIYGQNDYGRGLKTNYEALEEGMKKVNEFRMLKNLPVYIPYKIGCGLAGGDWEIVKNIIKNTIPTAKIILKRS